MAALHQQLAAGLLRRLADEVEQGSVTLAEAVVALTALLGAGAALPGEARLKAETERDRMAERARAEHSIPAPSNPEAAALLEALAQKHGSESKAQEALGVRPSVWGTWRSGRVSAGALGRLREAVNAPLGRGGRPRPKKAEGQEVGDAGPLGSAGGPEPDGT